VPKLKEIFLIAHSHTDIGFTHDQPIVTELHKRFIDQAIDYLEHNDDPHFHWTIETSFALETFVERSSDRRIALLQKWMQAGRIEATGMYTVFCPLYNHQTFVNGLQRTQNLAEQLGIQITSAMNCDVNGHNWIIADELVRFGYTGFSMAINNHFGRAPLFRPLPFIWQGPGGNEILVNSGPPYGHIYDIGSDTVDFEQKYLPLLEQHVARPDYPSDKLYLQSVEKFGDNGSIVTHLGPWIERWNQTHEFPKIRWVTPRVFWNALEADRDKLPVHRGDWTDFWNFGSISAARQLQTCRRNDIRLMGAERFWSVAKLFGERQDSVDYMLDTAWKNHLLYHEHTWGADCGIEAPQSEDSDAMWYHKAGYAYNARSHALFARREAIAQLSRSITRNADDAYVVFNPFAFESTITGTIAAGTQFIRGNPQDSSAPRHIQDRKEDLNPLLSSLETSVFAEQYPQSILKPTKIPAFGWKVIGKQDIFDAKKSARYSNDTIVLGGKNCVSFDPDSGAITSWKHDGREMISADTPGFGEYVYETVDSNSHWPRSDIFSMDWSAPGLTPPDGWNPDWPARREGTTQLLEHRVVHLPHATLVQQRFDAPGCDGVLKRTVTIAHFADWIEVAFDFVAQTTTAPHAHYATFPLKLDKPTVYVDSAGIGFRPQQDQIEGTCHDYYTASDYVDLHDTECGVCISTPINPMVMFGDFTFGKARTTLHEKTNIFIGWITNTYWETNFRAAQPGTIQARYRFHAHGATYEPHFCYSRSLEARMETPLIQHLQQGAYPDASLPRQGTLIGLPDERTSGIRVVHMQYLGPKKLGLTLCNMRSEQSTAAIGQGALPVQHICSNDSNAHCSKTNSGFTVQIAPHKSVVLTLDIT